MGKYQHITEAYPYLDNLYIPDNTFDYRSWGVGTKIRLLHVSWDRDYNNVVKFDDDAARDKWTDEHTTATYTLETAINVQPDGVIKLPVPFDVLARCNFIVVEYAFAPVDYETTPRISRMGYFIDNVQQLAPSTTAARVSLDYWYTYINELDVTYMMLDRGHAPVAATDADHYLEDPINRNLYLTAPDVSFGPERARVNEAAAWIANDTEAYAVIACTGNILSDAWGVSGNRNMQTPGIASADWYGLAGGLDYFALRLSDLNTFIVLCNTYRPHFLPTVQGLFLVPGKLLTLVQKFTWENFTGLDLWTIDTSQKYYNLIKLDKGAFNYPKQYRDLAKLYTAPYAHLELTDETGRVSRIDIENTSGKLDVEATLNLVHPFVGLDVMVLGNASEKVISTAYGYGTSRAFKHGGDWYTTMHRYNIPSFIVSQSQNDRARFNRFFPNAQAATARDNSLASSLASNDTAKTNADAGANTANTNALASNDTQKNNTSDANSRAYNNSSTSINAAFDITEQQNETAWNDLAAQKLMSRLRFQTNMENAIVTALGNTVSSAAGGLSGGTLGGVGAAVGVITDAVTMPIVFSNDAEVQGGVEANITGTARRHYGDTVSLGSEVDGVVMYAARKTKTANFDIAQQTLGTQTIINNRTKTTADANANRTLATQLANNSRNKSTGDANANRTAATATAAIDNGNRAQGVEAPAVYAGTNNAATVATRPMGLFCNIVTQSLGAIKAAGDIFLRYGYALGQNWQVEQLQLMRYFTYWKASDLWIGTKGQAIEDAADIVKAIFVRGVTVWDDPSKIGHVSIYENLKS